MGAAAGWEIGRALFFPWNTLEENCRRGRKINLVIVNAEGHCHRGVLGKAPLMVLWTICTPPDSEMSVFGQQSKRVHGSPPQKENV